MGRRAGTPWARVLGVALVATLAAASALASGAEAQDSWREVAPMRKARSGLAAGMVGGKLYALGGYEYPDTLDTVEVYDPATDTWAAVAPMPTARHELTSQTQVWPGATQAVSRRFSGAGIARAPAVAIAVAAMLPPRTTFLLSD